MAHEGGTLIQNKRERDLRFRAECRLLRSEARDASGYVELFRSLARQPHEDLAAERVRAKVLVHRERKAGNRRRTHKRGVQVRLAFRGSDDIVRRQREAVDDFDRGRLDEVGHGLRV